MFLTVFLTNKAKCVVWNSLGEKRDGGVEKALRTHGRPYVPKRDSSVIDEGLLLCTNFVSNMLLE